MSKLPIIICLIVAVFHVSFAYADVSVRDDSLRTVHLEKPARRIISLAPHVTELVYAAGAGKYLRPDHELQDRAMAYDDLPEHGPARDYGTFERLIEDDSVKLRDPYPKTNGWWPAVMINWKGQAEFHGMERSQYYQAVASGKLPAYLPCGYQVIDGVSGTTIMEAWPIRLTSRL